MQKIIITENNIFDVAGRLRKFFSSCHDWGMYDKQSIKIKRESDIKKIQPYNWNHTKHYSCPSKNQEYNIYVQRETDNLESLNFKPIGIGITCPVKTDLRIGDVVYFDGYRVFTRSKGRLINLNLKSQRMDYTILSSFVDAYIKCINPDYD